MAEALPRSTLQQADVDRLSGKVLRRNVKQFRGGLVSKAYRLLYHSTLGLRVIEKKRKDNLFGGGVARLARLQRVFIILKNSQGPILALAFR